MNQQIEKHAVAMRNRTEAQQLFALRERMREYWADGRRRRWRGLTLEQRRERTAAARASRWAAVKLESGRERTAEL